MSDEFRSILPVKMNKITILVAAILPLAACGQEPAKSETAEEYAARINGSAIPAAAQPQAQQAAAIDPVVAARPPEIITVPGKPAATAAPCAASSADRFLGQTDSAQLRNQLAKFAPAGGMLRFVHPGQAMGADHRVDRLNVLLDSNGVIRDFRCG